MILTGNYLEKLRANEMINLAEFVVKENYKHHSRGKVPNDYKDEIWSIQKEEMGYIKDSEIFVVKNNVQDIIGSIRILKWNYYDVLPLQKIFGISPLVFKKDILSGDVWHIGRLAIKKGIQDITLFKKLMVCAISPICNDKKGIAFAECDSKLLRVLKLLGLKATVIGESKNYLGSETIPICMTYRGLIDFYKENMALVPSNVLQVKSNLVKTVNEEMVSVA